MAPSPSEPTRTAIQLAERLIQLLGRGGFTATYKYAVLVALMDLCLELTSATGAPPEMITTRQVAEKVVALYWLHCAPYEERGVLRQSRGGEAKSALIVRHILQFRDAVDPKRERSLSLAQARAKAKEGQYEGLVREIEWTLIHMPLPRLQRVGPEEEDTFLYEYSSTQETPRGVVNRYQRGEPSPFDNRLNLRPGVSAALIALNGVLRPLIYRNWAMMVAHMNGLDESRLEDFLFGKERISLLPVRAALHEIQGGLCFYCVKRMTAECHVDHFVPWARHADNSIDNLVAAHDTCNGRKSDYLAAAEHVERWRERSTLHAADLAAIAREKTWESQAERTFSVARAIYRMLPDDARLWRAKGSFVLIEHPRIAAALAA